MDNFFHRHCTCFEGRDDWRTHRDDVEAPEDETRAVRPTPSAPARARRNAAAAKARTVGAIKRLNPYR